MKKIIAQQDQDLSARVVSIQPLFYSAPSPQQSFVRSGSAVAWAGTRLAVVQDDSLFVALVDPASEKVTPISVSGGPDDTRAGCDKPIDKAHKLDLEACLMADKRLIAFGSGSAASRERLVVVDDLAERSGVPSAKVIDATALYCAFRREKNFSGSQLNIEGAVWLGDAVRFFQRGNGIARDGLEPVNATCQLEVDYLHKLIDNQHADQEPQIGSIIQYELGEIGGVRLTFTDAVASGDRVLFLAVAEDSPDAIQDGPITGMVLGVIEADGSARWTQLADPTGRPFLGKAEGIVIDPTNPARAYLVVDRDDPDKPAELCVVELGGF
jgi:uncharacterized protein DUF6929